MPIQKITGPDSSEVSGFVVVDLDGAAVADGVVRCAKKILLDGARTMARSRTYAWALLQQPRSGASAAINVAPPQHADGIEVFIEAVSPRVQSGELSLDAGKGVGRGELAPLDAMDARGALHRSEFGRDTVDTELAALSVVTAAAVALDGLEGTTVAIEGAGQLGPSLLDHLAAAGARVVAVGTPAGTMVRPEGMDPVAVASEWAEHGDALPAESGSDLPPDEVFAAGADLLLCGSKLGAFDHATAERCSARLVVPVGVAPVTAKGLAVAGRNGALVLPDFLSLSGPLHAWVADGDVEPGTLTEAVRRHTETLTRAALAHTEGPYLGACAAAEDYLSSWVADLPFGRPLA